jgi:hypothetical protein
MAPEPISTAEFISLCLRPSMLLGKPYCVKDYIRNNRTTEDEYFCVLSLSYQRKVCENVYPSALLGSGSVNKFPRQRGIAGRVVFCEVLFISRKVGDYFVPEVLVLRTRVEAG